MVASGHLAILVTETGDRRRAMAIGVDGGDALSAPQECVVKRLPGHSAFTGHYWRHISGWGRPVIILGSQVACATRDRPAKEHAEEWWMRGGLTFLCVSLPLIRVLNNPACPPKALGTPLTRPIPALAGRVVRAWDE